MKGGKNCLRATSGKVKILKENSTRNFKIRGWTSKLIYLKIREIFLI